MPVSCARVLSLRLQEEGVRRVQRRGGAADKGGHGCAAENKGGTDAPLQHEPLRGKAHGTGGAWVVTTLWYSRKHRKQPLQTVFTYTPSLSHWCSHCWVSTYIPAEYIPNHGSTVTQFGSSSAVPVLQYIPV